MSKNMHPLRKGTRLRRPEALLRGKEYKLKHVIQEESAFKKDNEVVMKTIIIFEDIGMTFHTYMPVFYDNKTEAEIKEFEEMIAKTENVRACFYGKIGQTNELYILKDGEEIDQEKLEGVALIEQAERGVYGSPGQPQPYQVNQISPSVSRSSSNEKDTSSPGMKRSLSFTNEDDSLLPSAKKSLSFETKPKNSDE